MFNHVDVSLPQLERETIDGVRYYSVPDEEELLRLVSITSVTSHFNKEIFVKWRKKVGDEEADRITSQCLRELAGDAAVKRGYVYFTEVPPMSGIDLVSLDRLWTVYSQGRFGFTAQSQLLSALDGRYERLWPRIGWKCDGVWTRYPGAFTWSIDAPEGHMPLINQLRGVRLMDSVLNHPALVARRS